MLSPTEYDPARITASGGVSLWLEARATWRLDRLVFADEEVALERTRSQREEAQAKLTERVLDLLFTWQRALVREADAAASPEEHLSATLKKIEAEVELDILTAGWFTRWRATRGEGARPRAARTSRRQRYKMAFERVTVRSPTPTSLSLSETVTVTFSTLPRRDSMFWL
jgi:hypothetical protein